MCGEEAVEQILRQHEVDLGNRRRRSGPAVQPWIVDVDVEAVLVRDVVVDLSSVAAAEVSDHDRSRIRVRRAVLADHLEHEPDERIGTVEAGCPVRRTVEHRIPGDPPRPLDRQLYAVNEPAGVGLSDRQRPPPVDRRSSDLACRSSDRKAGLRDRRCRARSR